MAQRIIADTSCLILLSKINTLFILQKLYGQVYITPQIAQEYGDVLPDYIRILPPPNPTQIAFFQDTIDLGEASAIVLALERENSLLIVDDRKARKVASMVHLKIVGTLGVILLAYENGIITDLKGTIKKIQKTDFRISKKILNYLLDYK